MDMSSGKIHEDLSEKQLETLRKSGVVKEITPEEHVKYANLSEADRPIELELSRYLERLSKKPGDMELFRIKAAFRSGYRLGRENNN